MKFPPHHSKNGFVWTTRTWNAARKRDKMMEARRNGAGAAVSKAIRNGDLPPVKYLFCFDCGKEAQCYDHRDYRKPLDVWPVCFSCDSKRGSGRPYDHIGTYWYERMIATEKRLGIRARK